MLLKTALCPTDTISEKVCFSCSKKLEENQITQLDITVSHKLGKLSKMFPLTNVEFKKAIELQELIVLVCTGTIGSLIGTKGKIVSEITKQLKKKVRIIEYTKNEKKMIQDLIGSARLIGLKKIFDPSFVEYKIIITKQDKEKLIASQKNLEDGLQVLLNANTKIVFD